MSALTDLWFNGEHRTICPDCGGGATKEKSFSLFRPEPGVLVGRCYRDACKFYLRELVDGAISDAPVPSFVPKPLTLPYRLKELGLFGERELVMDPTVTVWLLRDIHGNRTGSLTRTCKKQISTFKEVDRPVYYHNGLAVYRTLWLFEDPRSAAMCAESACALLGTSLPSSLLEDLQGLARKPTVFVALDPGAEEAAGEVHRRLRDAGLEAVFVPMQKDFKDMTPDERDELLETYS